MSKYLKPAFICSGRDHDWVRAQHIPCNAQELWVPGIVMEEIFVESGMDCIQVKLYDDGWDESL